MTTVTYSDNFCCDIVKTFTAYCTGVHHPYNRRLQTNFLTNRLIMTTTNTKFVESCDKKGKFLIRQMFTMFIANYLAKKLALYFDIVFIRLNYQKGGLLTKCALKKICYGGIFYQNFV